MSGSAHHEGPDLQKGVSLSAIPEDGMLLGHVLGEPVVLVRRGPELFAVGASCTHYGAPLQQGLLVGDSLRCPWHHACFSLRTGEALRAPARDGLPRWRVEEVTKRAAGANSASKSSTVYVREKLTPPVRPLRPPTAGKPLSVVVIGGGAAGNSAVEALRAEGYGGEITVLSADGSLPCDRPNLSKGYLAGTASDQSNALRSVDFYAEHDIAVRTDARVVAIDPIARQVELIDGSRMSYGALLLAMGAEPIRLAVPGADLPLVHYLRSVSDARSLVAATASARSAVVVGASFIGLEVAASLRARQVAVHIVAPEAVPMERILGPRTGAYLRDLHEAHGVVFHLGTTVASISHHGVTLENGESLRADLVVVGVGVRPALVLAEQAGLAIDRGVAVDQYLETSVGGIFAAGDIARWPDPHSGERIRVEHFVVAERQGQTAARNILGRQEPFDAVPFFWTEQYDFSLAYVGHAERWDQAEIDGSLREGCTITYRREGKKLAAAFVRRDHAGLLAELEFEQTLTSQSSQVGASAPDRKPKEGTQS